MKNFLQNLAYKMQGFLQGRNGDDEFNHFLTWTGFILVVASLFSNFWYPLKFLVPAGFALFVFSIVRMLSRNIYRRRKENSAYLKLTSGIRRKFSLWMSMFRERKVFKYYRCPKCKAYVRIKKPPKGKNIAVRCTKCGNEFIKHT